MLFNIKNKLDENDKIINSNFDELYKKIENYEINFSLSCIR